MTPIQSSKNRIFSDVVKTSAYVITASDSIILCDASGGTFSVTLPPASENRGRVFTVRNWGTSNSVLLESAGGDVENDSSVMLTTGASATVFSDGTGWFIV